MAKKVTERPSKRGAIAEILPSGGRKGDTVPLAVGRGYNFHEFVCHLGNVGSYKVERPLTEAGSAWRWSPFAFTDLAQLPAVGPACALGRKRPTVTPGT